MDTCIARFKEDQRARDQMLYASLLEQLSPGTLEHAIAPLVDAKVGAEIFEGRYSNDKARRMTLGPCSQGRPLRLLARHGVLLKDGEQNASPA